MIVDTLAEMQRQCASGPLVMGIALHPDIVGQPHRLHHLRRAFRQLAAEGPAIWQTRPGDIARHVEALAPSIVPGSAP